MKFFYDNTKLTKKMSIMNKKTTFTTDTDKKSNENYNEEHKSIYISRESKRDDLSTSIREEYMEKIIIYGYLIVMIKKYF